MSKTATSRKQKIIIYGCASAFAALVLIVSMLILWTFRSVDESAFFELEIGMTMAEVEEKMGKPITGQIKPVGQEVWIYYDVPAGMVPDPLYSISFNNGVVVELDKSRF